MFHMLTCFNLKSGIELDAFKSALDDFVDYMAGIGLVESTSPIGARQSDTVMDSDNERDHEYFFTMTFRDRGQVDEAVTLLYAHEGQSEAAHHSVYSKVKDQVFICWQDVD